jgi:hypothetical protein
VAPRAGAATRDGQAAPPQNWLTPQDLRNLFLPSGYEVLRQSPEVLLPAAWSEVVFVEGGSTDDTYAAIEAAIQSQPPGRFRLLRQPGKGKGDAVRAGFAVAGVIFS